MVWVANVSPFFWIRRYFVRPYLVPRYYLNNDLTCIHPDVSREPLLRRTWYARNHFCNKDEDLRTWKRLDSARIFAIVEFASLFCELAGLCSSSWLPQAKPYPIFYEYNKVRFHSFSNPLPLSSSTTWGTCGAIFFCKFFTTKMLILKSKQKYDHFTYEGTSIHFASEQL